MQVVARMKGFATAVAVEVGMFAGMGMAIGSVEDHSAQQEAVVDDTGWHQEEGSIPARSGMEKVEVSRRGQVSYWMGQQELKKQMWVSQHTHGSSHRLVAAAGSRLYHMGNGHAVEMVQYEVEAVHREVMAVRIEGRHKAVYQEDLSGTRRGHTCPRLLPHGDGHVLGENCSSLDDQDRIPGLCRGPDIVPRFCNLDESDQAAVILMDDETNEQRVCVSRDQLLHVDRRRVVKSGQKETATSDFLARGSELQVCCVECRGSLRNGGERDMELHGRLCSSGG